MDNLPSDHLFAAEDMDSLGFPHRHQVSNHGNTSSTSGLHPGEAGATAIFSTQGLDLQDYAAALAHNINMSGLTTDFQVEGIKQDVSAVHGSSSRNSVNSGNQVGVPAINQNDMNSLFFVGQQQQQQQNTVPHNIAFPQALNSSVHSVNVGGIQLQMGSLPALDATVLNKMELQTSPATSLHLTASVPASSSVAAASSASLPSISMVSFAPSQPHPPLLAVSKTSSLQNEIMMQSLRIPTSTIQPQMSMSPSVTGLTHISTATAGPGQHHQVSFQNTVSEQLKVEQSNAKKAVNQIAMTSLASASSSSLLPSSSSSSASALLTQNVSDRVPPVDQPPLLEPRIPVQTSISIPIEGSSECLQDVQLLVVPDRQNPGRIFLTGVASASDNLLSVINQTQLCIDEQSERNFVPIFLNENVNGCNEKSQQLDTNSLSVKKGKGSKKAVLSAKMDKQKQKVESITVNRVNDNTTTVRVILTSGIAGGVRKSKVRRFPAKNAKQTNHSSAVEEEINFSFENKVTSNIKSGSEALSKETHAAENGGSQTISHRSSAVDDRNEEGPSVNKSNISMSQQSEKQVGDQDRRDTNDNNDDESDDDDDDNDDDDESDKSENSSHKNDDKTRDECGQKSTSVDPNLDELMHPILSSELAVESTQRTEINIQIDDSQCVVENGQKRWTCHLCPKNYTTKHNLITHILDHNGIKPHCCIICGRFFKQLSHLNTHMLTHNNVKPHACTVCGRAFTQISHVKRHMATHMSEKPHVCELCGRGFAYPSEMRTHMEKHKKTQGLCCELCDNAFASAKLLKQHMETHKDHEGLTCTHCKRIFQYPSQLKDHMVKHSGKRPCICTECGMDFMKEHHLRAHMFTHTGLRPWICPICQRSFNQKANMQRHLLTHAGEKRFQCRVCDKYFSQPQTLKAHQVTHADKKPYQCSICGKEFGRLHNLQGHMHLHNNSKPYMCFCGASFTLKGNLSRHKKVKHGLNTSNECTEEEAAKILNSMSERRTLTDEGGGMADEDYHDAEYDDPKDDDADRSMEPRRKQRKSIPRKHSYGIMNRKGEAAAGNGDEAGDVGGEAMEVDDEEYSAASSPYLPADDEDEDNDEASDEENGSDDGADANGLNTDFQNIDPHDSDLTAGKLNSQKSSTPYSYFKKKMSDGGVSGGERVHTKLAKKESLASILAAKFKQAEKEAVNFN